MNKEEPEYKIRGVVGFMVKGQTGIRIECGRDVRDPSPRIVIGFEHIRVSIVVRRHSR